MNDAPMTEITRAEARELAELSPFECKARLLRIATASAHGRGTRVLDAGRGNPNWVATTPRAAFFLLGQFALGESRRVWDEPWSVRVSLANLDDNCYLEVGAAITRIFDGYVEEWRTTTVRLDTIHQERHEERSPT